MRSTAGKHRQNNENEKSPLKFEPLQQQMGIAMTLIRELIDIPEQVDKGAFVLRLTEGVDDKAAQQTIDSYVCTEQLAGCFEQTLGLIKTAIQENSSRGAYLHGSFGSGKSHFMAILHLILQGNTAAKSISELATSIDNHSEWIDALPGDSDRRFLLVPYHMIGSKSMEDGVLGGYVEHIRRIHPDAPIPAVYKAELLFEDAKQMRDALGDDAFFEGLAGSDNEGGGWGELESGWTAERFETAIDAEPSSSERMQLINALIKTHFQSYTQVAQGTSEAFVDLDSGLEIISKHARDLGYSAVVLFLDELILWLAGHAADINFVHHEGQKLVKLVEAQAADRPIPLVSFIARQRDLRKLIGENVPGAELLGFTDTMDWQENRFSVITLEDRNLHVIANKRILKPRDDAARTQLDAAFEQAANVEDSTLTTLLTGDGDRQMFREVYPFSPALITTLVAVSSLLQRERTALKVMMQLLVNQRDTLKVNDIVPVGDLYDIIAHGDEAFSAELAIHFGNAKKLYHHKLLPLLEEKHHLRADELNERPWDDRERTAFRNDDRLVKTLLLSALCPEVEPLRALTGQRLAALNHGSIKTPILGQEATEVIRRCKEWAAAVGEIRIGEEANPTISIQLSGVDTDAIIEQALGEDSRGNRIRLVRDILTQQLEIEGENELERYRGFTWRNTSRSCTILLGNIRELPNSSIQNSAASDWKVIIDYPFDEQGYGPRDDLSRLQEFRENNPEGGKTICWVPSFLSDRALKDLGDLLIHEHVLAGQRFDSYAANLSQQDRPVARQQLENRRSVLRQQVGSHLAAAYGLPVTLGTAIDTQHELEPEDQFVSLKDGFAPRRPAAPGFSDALLGLLDQALSFEFPAAPEFTDEIKRGNLNKVLEDSLRATADPQGRVEIEKPRRPLMRAIANPLQLGDMAADATHFVLGTHWKNHFVRKTAEAGGDVSVADLRRWIDDPQPMGLTPETQNLLLLTYAAQENSDWFLHNAPFEASLTRLPDECVLQKFVGPSNDEWDVAVQRAAEIFGVTVSSLITASNVETLTKGVIEIVEQSRSNCQRYRNELDSKLKLTSTAADDSDRMTTATATLTMVEELAGSSGNDLVSQLAGIEIPTSAAAIGKCLKGSGELADVLSGSQWDLLSKLPVLHDDRQDAAEEILSELAEALVADEHAKPLKPSLDTAHSKAIGVLTTATEVPPPPSDPPIQPPPKPLTPDPPPPAPGQVLVSQGNEQNIHADRAREVLDSIENDQQEGQQILINLSWRIETQEGDES
jgi:hypothetical protein